MESNAIVFSNGCSFKLCALAINKILGIPYGGQKILRKPTVQASLFIKNDTKCLGDTPTIKELIDILSVDVPADSFLRAFLLFALSTFLCPTTHGHASARYFPPLLNVDEIESYDWSLLVFEWLIDYVKRYKQKISSGKSPALGGCTFFLVVCIWFIPKCLVFNFFVLIIIAYLIVLILTNVGSFFVSDMLSWISEVISKWIWYYLS